MTDYDISVEEFEYEEYKDSYEERNKELQKRKKQIDELSEKRVSSEEEKQLIEQADKIEKYYVYDLWRNFFNRISFCNEIPCKAIFHSMIGQCLASPLKKIEKGNGTYLDWRTHFFWIQNSGSGKGQATWAMNCIFKHLLKGVSKTKDRINYRKLKIRKCDSETDAALLDDYIFDSKIKKYTTEVNYGILTTSDFVYWEEARPLLEPSKYNDKMREILISVAEPISQNGYSKTLKGYPEPLVTVSNASIIATTRPIRDIKSNLLYNGLLQRCIMYVRDLDSDTRLEMNKLTSLTSFKNRKDKFDIDKEALVVANEMKKVVDFAWKHDIGIKEDEYDALAAYINEKIVWFHEDILDVSNSEHINLLESFISRYRDLMLKIAYHSAAMRYSPFVSKADIEYAFQFIKELYEQLKLWIDVCVFEDREIRLIKRDARQVLIKFLVKQQYGVPIKVLVEEIMEKLGKSQSGAYYLIQKNSKGKHSLLVSENRIVSLRSVKKKRVK